MDKLRYYVTSFGTDVLKELGDLQKNIDMFTEHEGHQVRFVQAIRMPSTHTNVVTYTLIFEHVIS